MTKRIAAVALAFATAACGRSSVPFAQGNSTSFTPERVALRQAQGDTLGTPIKHVVYVVQENRSFNNLFMGFPNAETAKYGYDSYGQKVKLIPEPLGVGWDVGHASAAFFAACDGKGRLPGTHCKMDGWLKEGTGYGAPKDAEYSYVKHKDIVPYWTMAEQYVLADHMFASNLDGSFIAHQYVVAAYASHAVDFPYGNWGCDGGSGDTVPTLTRKRVLGPPILACFRNPTIASEADKNSLSWRFYSSPVGGNGGIWSSYQADHKIYYGPDWKTDVINPQTKFLKDVAKGELAAVTWITPQWQTSDHPGITASQGPSWVASIVDAVGKSKFWDSTAIFVQWDDWGGLFDPVKPVFEDYDGLGFRVPLIIISPYAKQGSVTHVQYETASVLRFIEDNFGLPQLAASDTRANDPANDPTVFDYSQPPRKFKSIAGGKPASYWMQLEQRSRPEKPASIIGDD